MKIISLENNNQISEYQGLDQEDKEININKKNNSIFDKIAKFNSENKGPKNLIKMGNRTLKLAKLLSLIDDSLIFDGIHFLGKSLSHGFHGVRSVTAISSANDKISFLQGASLKEQSLLKKAYLYPKTLVETFIWGRGEERRRIAKLGLAGAMTTAFIAHCLCYSGALNALFPRERGDSNESDAIAAFLANTLLAIKVGKTCRKFIQFETTIHRRLFLGNSNEKKYKKKYEKFELSSKKTLLNTGRLGFEYFNFLACEKVLAIALAAVSLSNSKSKKAKKTENNKTTEKDKTVENKVVKIKKLNKKEKADKSEKKSVTTAHRLDNLARFAINLLICYQLCLFIAAISHPLLLGKDEL